MKTNPNYLFLVAFLLVPLFSSAGWDAITSYPSAGTDGAFTFNLGGKAYVGGGLADNRLYSFDAATGEWSRLADVPGSGTHRAWAFSFAVNGKAYVACGSFGTASDLDNDLWEYDPALDEWTQKADFPGGNRDAGFSFAIADKGYVGGGFDGEFLEEDMYSYEPAQDKWTKLNNFPGGPVIFPVAFVIQGKAYVGTGGQGSEEIQGFWEFDPSGGNTWKQVADFGGAKRQCAVAVTIGDKGYVGGGMTGYATNRTDFWEYDPAGNSWKVVSRADFPTTNTAWSTAFALGNDMYFGLGVDFPAFTFSKAFHKRSFGSVSSSKKILTGSEQISVYPVPASNKLTLAMEGDLVLRSVSLYDFKGQLCGYSEEKEMNISALAPGIYHLKIRTDQGILTRTFTKQ